MEEKRSLELSERIKGEFEQECRKVSNCRDMQTYNSFGDNALKTNLTNKVQLGWCSGRYSLDTVTIARPPLT